MKRLLIQTQLSNFNDKYKSVLECDSGWQMVMGRVREMLKLNPDLHIDVMGPDMDEGHEQCVTHPYDVNPDLWDAHAYRYGLGGVERLRYLGCKVLPNALVTRYDFDWPRVTQSLDVGMHKLDPSIRYDAVYMNDPMHLRNFKAMFHVIGGYQPKFYVHSHFVDLPTVPKFPKEASLWLGQCEATIRADHNFWQCDSAMNQFFNEMGDWFMPRIVEEVRSKSTPWDDGYSATEITSPIDNSNMRFTVDEWQQKTHNKVVLFFPNRISPSSGDYTNGMKFMFELLPEIRKQAQDFVVVCGNPNFKFINEELLQRCGKDGYVKLHDHTLNRDEFKFVARNSHVALGLYDKDTYGGTAARECVELGCMPLWLENFEYSSLAREALVGHHALTPANFSTFVQDTVNLIKAVRHDDIHEARERLKKTIRRRCSYEMTTPAAMKIMGLLPVMDPGVCLAYAGGDNLARFGDTSPPTGS